MVFFSIKMKKHSKHRFNNNVIILYHLSYRSAVCLNTLPTNTEQERNRVRRGNSPTSLIFPVKYYTLLYKFHKYFIFLFFCFILNMYKTFSNKYHEQNVAQHTDIIQFAYNFIVCVSSINAKVTVTDFVLYTVRTYRTQILSQIITLFYTIEHKLTFALGVGLGKLTIFIELRTSATFHKYT